MKNIVLFLFLLSPYYAKEYVVVSNMNVKQLSKEQVKAIFLKKNLRLDGTKLVPVNLSYNSEVRKSFETNILKMGKSRLKSYWSKQHYMGIRPPVSLKSQEASVSFVKNVDGAIAYMELEKYDSTLNILYKWSDKE